MKNISLFIRLLCSVCCVSFSISGLSVAATSESKTTVGFAADDTYPDLSLQAEVLLPEGTGPLQL